MVCGVALACSAIPWLEDEFEVLFIVAISVLDPGKVLSVPIKIGDRQFGNNGLSRGESKIQIFECPHTVLCKWLCSLYNFFNLADFSILVRENVLKYERSDWSILISLILASIINQFDLKIRNGHTWRESKNSFRIGTWFGVSRPVWRYLLVFVLSDKSQFDCLGWVLDTVCWGAIKVGTITDEYVRYDFSEIFVCPVDVKAIIYWLVVLKCVHIYVELALVIIILFANWGTLCIVYILLLILDAFLIVCGAKHTLFCRGYMEFVKGIIIVETGEEYGATFTLIHLKFLQVFSLYSFIISVGLVWLEGVVSEFCPRILNKDGSSLASHVVAE